MPLLTAAAGTRLEVVEEGDEWTRVRFADPQFGPRLGWIDTKLLDRARPETQPMDLSIPAAPPVDPAVPPKAVAASISAPVAAAAPSTLVGRGLLSDAQVLEAIKAGEARKFNHLVSDCIAMAGFGERVGAGMAAGVNRTGQL